jgi:hypothetical protein
MPATAGGMRGGGETAGEVDASPAESADEFVFDTYMSLSRMGGGKVDYGVAKINRLREGLGLSGPCVLERPFRAKKTRSKPLYRAIYTSFYR